MCLLSKDLLFAEPGPHLKFPTTPRERICIASYPFREFITGTDAKPGATPPMDLKDFAAHAKQKFGIDKIEPWSGHFPSTDPKYIEQFRLTVDRAQCFIVNMAVDGESSPYSPHSAERAKAVDFSKRWIDIAAAINSPRGPCRAIAVLRSPAAAAVACFCVISRICWYMVIVIRRRCYHCCCCYCYAAARIYVIDRLYA